MGGRRRGGGEAVAPVILDDDDEWSDDDDDYAPSVGSSDGDGEAAAPKYFRTGALGMGSYGSVVLAYDDEGHEWAAKLFDADDDDENEDDEESTAGLDLGILREISVLKLIDGAHPGIMRVQDVTELVDDGELRLCMVMPRLAGGSLAGAIEGGTLSNKDKFHVACHALDALAFLHSHGIMHRDIKPDNILLDAAAEGRPVLADFSLAKQHGHAMSAASKAEGTRKTEVAARKRKKGAAQERAQLHTAGMGTATYTAPEVVSGSEYDLKADVWSLGVCLLELFSGALGTESKNKAAFAQIEALKAKMGDKPIPTLIKAMLAVDPQERPSAAEALAMLPGREKIALPHPGPLRQLPPVPERSCEPAAAAVGGKSTKKARGRGARAALTTARACGLLEAQSPLSATAADCFLARSAVAREHGAAGVAACALLACKLHEAELLDGAAAEELLGDEEEMSGFGFADLYGDLERQIVEELDWCLALPDLPNLAAGGGCRVPLKERNL